MNVTVNNALYDFEENAGLEQILEQLRIEETKGVALALNEEIIPKSEWPNTKITEGDKIIIIGAVAGG